MTLGHPHGQLYAFPYLTPRTDRLAQVAAEHRAATGGNLLDDVLAAERVDSRVVLAGEHWTAYVPAAARWPYQVRMQPHQRVPDFPALGDAARAELPPSTWSWYAALTHSSTPRVPPTSPPGTRPRPPPRAYARSWDCCWSCSPSGAAPTS